MFKTPANLKKTILIIILFLLTGCCAFFLFPRAADLIKEARDRKTSLSAWQVLRYDVSREILNSKLEAGVVICDLRRGRQLIINQNKRFPSASLVKVPIMAACFYAQKEGKLNLKDSLVIKNRVKALGSGRLKNMADGTAVNIRDLIEIMVIESDNTATNMLIERLGFDYLNNIFKKVGLEDTNISRYMMDFKSRKKGIENYTTARDIALLFNMIYSGRLINKKVSQECLDILKRQKMKDRIPAHIPVGVVVGHKTGLENSVCHDAGIVFTSQGDFLLCALVKHRQKTSKMPKEFISDLALRVYNYMVRDSVRRRYMPKSGG